jgi:Ca-activated chloride channel family protein
MIGIRIVTLYFGLIVLVTTAVVSPASEKDRGPGGSLNIIHPEVSPGSACPLEHTSVKAELSGFVARTRVTQVFKNPLDKKIEAVYTFPLSAQGAVDEMLMRVGDREIKGVIKKREEARRIYDEARQRGKTASLLDQERPNIFTQSVANIMPGETVEITIKYVEPLAFDDGAFTYSFPMVVGPRFIPRTAANEATAVRGDGVPDAGRITPPVTPKGTRAGHDVDLTVTLHAPVPVSDITCPLHEVVIERPSPDRATVTLKNNREIPNRDFTLTYTAAGDRIHSGILTHKTGKRGFVTVVVIPPKRVAPEAIAPKEMVFVIDCSGSQAGWPLAKAKEAMKYFIDRMNPNDTFNIIDFNVGARQLFSKARKNSPETRKLALEYLEGLEARGGTWMGDAVAAVCKVPPPEHRLRIVTFMTDGYVGNDFEIIGLVKKLRGNSRWFPFGTGNSVNRFLLEGMARVGGGEPEYVLLNTPAEEAAKRFYDRIASPALTDAKIEAEGVTLEEISPAQPNDLWARKPLIFTARYKAPGQGTLIVRGFSGGKPYEERLAVTLPEREEDNAALASLWARAKVEALMDEDMFGAQRGAVTEEIRSQIVNIALEHKIITQYTSFVAVEETVIKVGGEPVKIVVPVEMPDGVSREGVFGETDGSAKGTGGAGDKDGGFLLGKLRAAARFSVAPFSERITAPATSSQGRAGAGASSLAPHKASANGMERKKANDRERNANGDVASEAAAKMAPELTKLLELIRKGYDIQKAAHEAGVTLDEGCVLLHIVFKGEADTAVALMEKAGLRVIFTAAAGKTVLGKALPDKLEKLAKLERVMFLRPASPNK